MSESTVALQPVCRVDEIAEEDVRQIEHDGQIYAVYHTPRGFYATDGLCTHEEEFLADGLVLGKMIECLRHQRRFHIPTGKAKGAPVCLNIRTYATKVQAQQVYIGIPNSV